MSLLFAIRKSCCNATELVLPYIENPSMINILVCISSFALLSCTSIHSFISFFPLKRSVFYTVCVFQIFFSSSFKLLLISVLSVYDVRAGIESYRNAMATSNLHCAHSQHTIIIIIIISIVWSIELFRFYCSLSG